MNFNDVTEALLPYPMEELSRIKKELLAQGKTVYDFGTGDPTIPTWEAIPNALKSSIPLISQYPSILGNPNLIDAIENYCHRRFRFQNPKQLMILPTNGSKEAVFHIALSLIGRDRGRDIILYPDPGYPVYRSATLFAGGRPYPVPLLAERNYQMEPWLLPSEIIEKTAALWINYPHNPTGATVEKDHLSKIIKWCMDNNILLLSDDCYIDIYNEQDSKSGNLPIHPLELATEGIISFMSLSKRSGLTGYRSGFMIGSTPMMNKLKKARANFGVATPIFIQEAATKAWSDDSHVVERRKKFNQRLNYTYKKMTEMGFGIQPPRATFYLWCKIPGYDDDISFCKELAQEGIIVSPSSWLSSNQKGFIRLALVPELAEIKDAMTILESFMTRFKKENSC